MEAESNAAPGGDKAVTADANGATTPESVTAADVAPAEPIKADAAASEPVATVEPVAASAKVEPEIKPEAAPHRAAKSAPILTLPSIRRFTADDAKSDAPRAAASAASTRRFGLLAASIALAAGLGGMLGAAGFAAVGKFTAEPEKPVPVVQKVEPSPELKALKDQLAAMRANIKTLSDTVSAAPRATSDKALNAQVGKLAEAVERIERSHAEPNAKLAKLTEAVDRLEKRIASSSAAVPQPAIDATGSVRPSPAAAPQMRPQDQRPPEPRPQVVDGWRLHEVYNGIAVIEGRYGPVEVQAGDDVRGLGRVQTIRRQDGRWVVQTSRGMIVSSR